jgi:hypothetical protein
MIDLIKRHPQIAACSLLLLLILLPYWKLTTMRGVVVTNDVFTSDLMNEVLPDRFAVGQALRHGEAPLWMPHVYGGVPLLALTETGACYPLNLFLFGVFSPYVALNLDMLITLLIAAMGMLFYARTLKAGWIASLVAAVSFVYSGFMVAHLKHLNMANSLCWFPIGLAMIEVGLAQRKTTPLLWLALIFGLQILAGFTQIAYYCGLVYILYFGCRWIHLRKSAGSDGAPTAQADAGQSPALRMSGRFLPVSFVLCLAIGSGIAAVQLLPTYELISLGQRSGGISFEYAAGFPYDPADIKTFVYPFANGDVGADTYHGSGVFWEDYGYAGLIPLLLALTGAFLFWRDWHIRFFVFVALISYLMVLGSNTPIFKFVFVWIPGMKYFRFPTRFLFAVDFSMAVMAAIAMTKLECRWPRIFARAGSALLVLVVVDLIFFQIRLNPIVDISRWSAPPETAIRLHRDPGLYRIYSPFAAKTHMAAFDQAHGWEGSLDPYVKQREILQPSSNVLYGLATPDGYVQLSPNSVVDIWGDQNRGGLIAKTVLVEPDSIVPASAWIKILSLFNVKYILSVLPVRSGELRLEERIGDVYLYRNPGVLPRAFLVGRYRIAANPLVAKAILLSEEFDPSKEAILYRSPPSSGRDLETGAKAEVRQYSYNHVAIRVHTSAGGLLVLSDTDYPGWRAEIDGRKTPILTANLCQRSVAVPAGDHYVRFVFDPFPVKAGLAITLLSLSVLLIIKLLT